VPSTLQALLVLILAVLPGALYVWGFEREAGKWGIGVSDTLLRFVTASAVFQAIYAPALYGLYQHYIHHKVVEHGHARYANRLADGPVPWWLWLIPAAYVLLPAAVGTAAGRSVRSKHRAAKLFARVVAGRDPAPRAWDDLFTSRPSGTVRIRLDDGSWVGGAFGADSYAAGYPEQPQDLLLEDTYLMKDDGSFAKSEDGNFVEIGSKLLVRWDQMDFLEFFPLPHNDDDDDPPPPAPAGLKRHRWIVDALVLAWTCRRFKVQRGGPGGERTHSASASQVGEN
jgi:hypothetical protein